MRKLLIALTATTALSTAAIATPVTDYIADEGSFATFADGVENGYFDSTLDNKIEFFFATGGAVDTDIGVLTGYYNARGNTVYQLAATDLSDDVVVLKYRPLQGNMRLEVNGGYIIGDTVAHLEDWVNAGGSGLMVNDMDSLMSWLSDANADFNRPEFWVATLEEAVS